MKSPFKVMSTAALAAAVAVPTLSVPAADAAETSSFHSVALETEDGSVKTVPFTEYAKAKTFGTGNLGEFVEASSVVAVSAEEGTFVSVRTLALAKIENPDADTAALLSDLDDSEDNLVAEEDVAEYTEWTDEDEVVAPAVESVSANNLKQVEVEFSGDLDSEVAGDADNYTLLNSAGDEIALDDATYADGKVVLTLTNAVDNQATAELTVDSAVTGEEAVEDVEFFDTEIPSVEGAEVIGESTIKVKFSEPINFGEAGLDPTDAFSVNDGEYFVKNVTPLKNNTEANVELYSSLDEGELDVSIDDILEDYAGFNVTATSQTLDVVVDDEAPEVVEYKDATPNGVTLVFNEDIQLADGVTVDDFYHTNGNNPVDSDDPNTANVDEFGAKVEGNLLHLSFTENNLPEGTGYVYIDGESVVDLWGNVNEQQLRTPVEVTIDETAPELEGVDVKDENKIEVSFSENLDSNSVDDEDFTLLQDGEELDLVDDVQVNGDKVTVTFDSNLSGEYGLAVDNLTDLSGNQIDKSTTEFNVDDLTKPEFSDFSVTTFLPATDRQKMVVNFGEQMAVDGKYSVEDVEKYVLTDGTNLSDISGAEVNATENNSKVEITVPKHDATDNTGYDLTTSGSISLARVADASGNTTEQLSGNIAVSGASNVSFKTAKLVNTDEIQVTFDDNFVDFDESDLAVYQEDANATINITDETSGNAGHGTIEADDVTNASEIQVAGVTTTGDNSATIKLESAVNTNALNGKLLVVAAGTDSVNRYSESLALEDTQVVSDYVAPQIAVWDHDGDGNTANPTPAVDDVQASAGQVTVTFTENINQNTVNALTFDVEDYSVNSASVNNNQVTLNLTDGDVVVPYGTEVTQVYPLKDTAGNSVSDLETSVTSSDNTLPTLNSYTFAENTTNEETITISVSEGLDLADGATVTGLSVSSDASATAVYDKSNDQVVITSSQDGAITSSATVSYDPATGNLEDPSENEVAQVSSQATSSPDNTAPSFTATEPTATTGSGSKEIDLTANTDENGTVYYVVLGDNATAPTSAQVKNGTDSNDQAVSESGSMNVTAGSGASTTVTAASGSTAYDVFFVTEDAANNLGTPVKVDATSNQSDVTAPTADAVAFSDASTTNGGTIDSDDTLTFTFSEELDPTTIDGSLTKGGSINGTLASLISKVGSFQTSFAVNNATDGSSSSLALSADGTTVTITATGFTSDGSETNPSGAFTPAAVIEDTAGNTVDQTSTPTPTGSF